MADEPQQAAPAAPELTTWETVKAGWKGFKDKVVGYIPYIPQGLLISAAVLGGLVVLGPKVLDVMPEMVNNLLGVEALGSLSGFATRLGVGMAASMLLSGGFGAIEEINRTSAARAPATGGPSAKQENGANVAYEREPEVVRPAGLPAPTHLAANGKPPVSGYART